MKTYEELRKNATEIDFEKIIDSIQRIYKSSNSVKNMVYHMNTIYIEYKNIKSALRICKKYEDRMFGLGSNITSFGASDATDYYKERERKILGNVDAKAYIEIEFLKEPTELLNILGKNIEVLK